MNEEYDRYGCEEDPRPNMSGSFYPPTWTVAKEIESMSKMIMEEYAKSTGHAIQEDLLTVKLMIGADGISGVSELKTSGKYHCSL